MTGKVEFLSNPTPPISEVNLSRANSCLGYNNHHFYIATFELEKNIKQKTIEAAKKLKDASKPTWELNRVARELCANAYEDFKREIKTDFSNQEYANLVSLTIKAKMKVFGIELLNDIKTNIFNLNQ